MVKKYIPQRGDIIWINFNPTKGHEQTGLRPALVISSSLYNVKAGLILVCPITSKIKGYPFEVEIKLDGTHGAILTDQIKSLDWKARPVTFRGKCTIEILEEVQYKLTEIISK